MLKKVIKTIVIVLIFGLVINFNDKMLPQRKELTDIAIVRIKGLDKIGETAVVSAVTINTQGQGSTGDSEGSSSRGNNSVVVSRGNSFKIAEKNAQSYTDKSIDAGHLVYAFIGEETAKTDFNSPISYIATNEEIRLSAKVYVIKGYSAEEFLKEVINKKYDISEKLRNLNNDKELGLSNKIDLTDIMRRMKRNMNTGVLPVLELEEEEVQSQGEEKSLSNSSEGSSSGEEKNQHVNFNLGGYAVFKDLKLIGYLTKEQSIGYNFIKNYIQSIALTVKNLSNKNLEVALTKAKTDIQFEFDNEKVKKIKIKVESKANIEEGDLVNQYFNPKERENLEKQMKEQIKNYIESAITVARELDVDYFNLKEDILSRKHPYKYEEIKDNITNIWNDADVEIIVDTKIERDYDVFKSDEFE